MRYPLFRRAKEGVIAFRQSAWLKGIGKRWEHFLHCLTTLENPKDPNAVDIVELEPRILYSASAFFMGGDGWQPMDMSDMETCPDHCDPGVWQAILDLGAPTKTTIEPNLSASAIEPATTSDPAVTIESSVGQEETHGNDPVLPDTEDSTDSISNTTALASRLDDGLIELESQLLQALAPAAHDSRDDSTDDSSTSTSTGLRPEYEYEVNSSLPSPPGARCSTQVLR